MPLTDVTIRNAKAGPKAIKLSDGGGMFLLVTPAGGKLWRFKYRIDGREKLLAIGSYPEIGLGEARRCREEARELVAKGKNPSREKQREKTRARLQAADTFKAISDEYCQKRRKDGQKGWAPATAIRSEYLLSLVCGSIGKLPIGDIEPADVLAAIRRIEGKGKRESARRSLQLTGAVFRYAVATARMASDPTRDMRGALRPMSENTINAGLRRLGYSTDQMTGHGFRAMASTLLNESGKWNPDAIERALAHRDTDKVRAAYHRGAHWQERVEMAQWWSDHLDTLRRGARIVSLPVRQGG